MPLRRLVRPADGSSRRLEPLSRTCKPTTLRRAVHYVKLNARRLGVDPHRLGVWGGSAAGHLSLMFGRASDAGDHAADLHPAVTDR